MSQRNKIIYVGLKNTFSNKIVSLFFIRVFVFLSHINVAYCLKTPHILKQQYVDDILRIANYCSLL